MTTTATINPDAAARLPGPDWLQRRRVVAAEMAVAAAMPSPDEEVWRYSPIDELDLDAFALLELDQLDVADQGPSAVPVGAQAVLDTLPLRSAGVVVRNGRVVHLDVASGLPDGALAIEGFAQATSQHWAPQLVGSVLDHHEDVFTTLNDAFLHDPVIIRVAPGVTLPGPVVVVDWVDAERSLVLPRLVVSVGENADAVVLEHHGGDDVTSLIVPVVELDVEQAGRLHYLNVQERGRSSWQIASQVSRVGRDATLVAAQAALGGAYARTRADCRLVGQGATGDLMAVYFAEDDQIMDFRTFQDHAAPDTTSNLLFKGAVGGHSRSIYTGLIRVRPEGKGTNAFQTNRNIKLSDDAWAESVPNLQIENNDVHCSHASTVGPIDEEQRFYLESRGVPPEVAERLIVAGFFGEIIDQLPVPETVAPLRARIAERLERREQA